MLISDAVKADQPFLSLEAESVILNWQDDFVLTLSIYAPQDMELPPVTIDGLDQFRLQGSGKNLLQIPRGKTKKWILTYTLVAADTGNFKLGPAVVTYNDRNYRSNIVFITVEGPAQRRQVSTPAKPEAQQSQAQKEKPAETPKKITEPAPKQETKKPGEPPKQPMAQPVTTAPQQKQQSVQQPVQQQKQQAVKEVSQQKQQPAQTPQNQKPIAPPPAKKETQPPPAPKQATSKAVEQPKEQAQKPPAPPPQQQKQATQPVPQQKQQPVQQQPMQQVQQQPLQQPQSQKPLSPPAPRKEIQNPPPLLKQEKQKPKAEEKRRPVHRPKPPEPPKKEKPLPVEKAVPVQQETIQPPVVISPEQIGDQILILMETRKNHLYQLQGIPVTVRLLSQLPVENLDFLEEADFPGFLRYDFPFTSKPKGEIVSFRNQHYASYELVKFLLFPIQEGTIEIPPVRCELRVRIPATEFPDKDLRLHLQRSSNVLSFEVMPIPAGAVVGDFVFRNEIVADEPESKTVRMILEGKGQLSTFEFPVIEGPDFLSRKLNVSTTAKIEGEYLTSRKIQEVEILPKSGISSLLLPAVQIQEFDPETATVADLQLPSMNLQFRLPGAPSKPKIPFPATGRNAGWILFPAAALFAAFLYLRNYKPVRRPRTLRLHGLFAGKNLKLQISKSAARGLYQEIARQIGQQGNHPLSMNDAIMNHLPQEEWLTILRGLRKLEQTAYSGTKPVPITYQEMKTLCERLETLWIREKSAF
jgi:hypothetical protein